MREGGTTTPPTRSSRHRIATAPPPPTPTTANRPPPPPTAVLTTADSLIHQHRLNHTPFGVQRFPLELLPSPPEPAELATAAEGVGRKVAEAVADMSLSGKGVLDMGKCATG